MKIAIIYTTSNKSTKKSCNILADKINGDVKLVSVKNAKTECILKYDFIILAASTINGKVQSELKIYISRNIKTLKYKPIALITNCEENKNMFNKAFTEELVNESCIASNFGYELNCDEGNYIEKVKTKRLIQKYHDKNKDLPSLNLTEIDKFANYINDMIEKRVD